MGIIGSIPSRWSSAAAGGVETGCSDIKIHRTVYHSSEHTSRVLPSIPLAIKRHGSATSTTLIGSSPLKSSDGTTGLSYATNIERLSEGSKHGTRIRRTIDLGVKCLSRKRARDFTTSTVSSSAKRRKGVEVIDALEINRSPIFSAPFAGTSKTRSSISNVNQRSEQPATIAEVPRLVNPHMKQCLVTKELESDAPIEPCYLLNPRHWRNNEFLTRLEWTWGMQYDSLELEIEANRIYLRRDLLELFDSNRWLLLPSPEMVNRTWIHCQKFLDDPKSPNQQPHIDTIYEGVETFEYRLLPLGNHIPSMECFDCPNSTGASSPPIPTTVDQTSTRHSYPFDTLPILTSRVKPHFVILDAAAKMFGQATSGPSGISTVVTSLWPISERDATTMLCHLEYVYRTWLEFKSPPSFSSTSRTPLKMSSVDSYTSLPNKRGLPLTACTGPCFRSRFVWLPLLCARCLGSRGHIHDDSDDGSTDSDYDELVSLSPSEAASEYRAYRRHLSRTVDTWRFRCMKEVGKRRGWTSLVLNDKQLGSYAEERPREFARTMQFCDPPI